MRLKILALTMLGALGATSPANAVLLFDQNVTPDVIFGTGNPNGGWTVDRSGGVELGLRAKLRGLPTFNSNGDGTYSFEPGISSGTAALWNYEFAANVNFDGSTTLFLGDVGLILSVDTDPGLGTSFVSFDIFQSRNGIGSVLGFTDNEVGDNSTPNGGGTPTNDITVFGPKIVAQNSQNLGFGNPPFFDANADGIYDFKLIARTGEGVLATTQIQVIVKAAAISAPASAGLFLLGLAAMAGLQRRRRRVA